MPMSGNDYRRMKYFSILGPCVIEIKLCVLC